MIYNSVPIFFTVRVAKTGFAKENQRLDSTTQPNFSDPKATCFPKYLVRATGREDAREGAMAKRQNRGQRPRILASAGRVSGHPYWRVCSSVGRPRSRQRSTCASASASISSFACRATRRVVLRARQRPGVLVSAGRVICTLACARARARWHARVLSARAQHALHARTLEKLNGGWPGGRDGGGRARLPQTAARCAAERWPCHLRCHARACTRARSARMRAREKSIGMAPDEHGCSGQACCRALDTSSAL